MEFAAHKIPVNIEDEMKRSYMDYAMSVIIGRALPDVRDGLKPAHRRVLYGMRNMGLASNRGYRKCAKIVGEVMGNYHPHGDASIYDTLVRLSQEFNMRYPLVDGQGNFGSVDGDMPAAMRYTEARLQSLADDLMADLEKETVDFVPNYDETTEEPTVLPAPIPNLLVNGSSGIAVGMATNVPPHNLTEVIDGVIYVIEEQQKARRLAGLAADALAEAGERATTREERLRQLFRLVTGPDFPTGGIIVGRSGIVQAYREGRGSITVRSRTDVETSKKGDRQSIVVTEILYQVNKKRLIENIADLVREKTIEGISDLRDESDRDGMRIVIELKRGEVPEVILNNLYKHTQLQTTFGIIMLAIARGRPKVLNLLEFIEEFIEFRREVVRRRTEFELRKAEARAHILEGLRIALDHLDEVIRIIRSAKTTAEAREGLITGFSLSQLQAQAILEMQLQRLTGLERQKIVDELAELMALIEQLRAILASDILLMQVVVDELKAVREKYGDQRRTVIIEAEGEFRVEDLIADEDVAITVSATGYIKRTAITEYRSQRRGGRGRIGMRTREEDIVNHLFVASTHSYILIFTDKGRCYWLKVHEIPDVVAAGKGKAIANLVSMQPDEKIASVLAVRELDTAGPLHRDVHAQGDREEDRAVGVQQPAGRRHHRHWHRRRRCRDWRAVVRWAKRSVHRHARRHGDPVPGVRHPGDGPHGIRRTGHHAARRGRSGRHGDPAARWDHSDGHRERLRQADRDRRVPGPGPRRLGHHQHPDDRAQRAGGRGVLCPRARAVDVHHRAGHDPADPGQRHLDHRPGHARRAAHRSRRRRPHGGGGASGRPGLD